jgi:glycosyltransferase involved in cell wall biosynthesis
MTPPRANGPDRAPVAVDWYAQIDGVVDLETAVRSTRGLRRLPPSLLARLMAHSATRGVLLFIASIGRPGVVIYRRAAGWHTLLLLRWLFGRRPKLIVLQLILQPARNPYRLVRRWLDRRLAPRTILRAHVLARAELEWLPAHYGMPRERFAYVPWFYALEPSTQLAPLPSEPLVLAAGRSYCDWPTFFAAVRDASWPVEVVCSGDDRRQVQELAAGTSVRVHCEIPGEQFRALLDRATVYAIVMAEEHISQGQVRIMEATIRGTPMVVTLVDGVRDYVVEGETALTVPPGDPGALRAAIERLIADRELAERLRTGAAAVAQAWGLGPYLEALADFVHGRPVRLPAGAPGEQALRRA